MLPLLIILLLLGLAGGYWLLHNEATGAFWELAGLGVFMLFLLLGIGLLARLTSRGGRR